MKIRRIYAGELAIGQALEWDVHGENGKLLVRQGHVVGSDKQITLLLDRGFVPDTGTDTAQQEEAPSALRLLNAAHARLPAALAALAGNLPGARQLLELVARLVIDAVGCDANVAVACVLHNQQASPYGIRHGIDTAVVALLVAHALKHGDAEINSMVLAALSMNIGMLEHQERLQSTETVLGQADLDLIRAHPQTSIRLLLRAGIDDLAWLAAVAQHHENEDGSGYPMGLRSLEICVGAKIIMLADRYCARVSLRGYRKTMLPNAALRDILLEANGTLNAPLAAVLIRELGIYPVGTCVRLINGEIAIVTRKGANSTAPHVQSLVGPRGAPLDVPVRRDSKTDLHAIRDVLGFEQAGLDMALARLWGASAKP